MTILLLPFSNAHIHLSETHVDDSHHHHSMEVHTFHDSHGHDSIDAEFEHASDATQVDLGEDAWLLSIVKIAKVFLVFFVGLFLFARIASRLQRPVVYHESYLNRFLFFHALVRGPPKSL